MGYIFSPGTIKFVFHLTTTIYFYLVLKCFFFDILSKNITVFISYTPAGFKPNKLMFMFGHFFSGLLQKLCFGHFKRVNSNLTKKLTMLYNGDIKFYCCYLIDLEKGFFLVGNRHVNEAIYSLM